jgi:DNA-binding FadR family transcriptional regulator
MLNKRRSPDLSEFLTYLANQAANPGRVPALTELGHELGISVAALREQLEVARALGLVEVRPRTGIRPKPYSFTPAVTQSLQYALALNDEHFQKFSELRNHLEAAYWNEAVRKLSRDDKKELRALVDSARERLRALPLQVPLEELRRLHLLIYSRLNNPFVTGILEAYWDAYEAVGLNLYAGNLKYLHEVWDYHAKMVESICTGNLEAGREALIRHISLLSRRPA